MFFEYIIGVHKIISLKLTEWFYEFVLILLLVIVLKLQPRIIESAIKGYGSALWLLSSIIATICYFILAFMNKSEKAK